LPKLNIESNSFGYCYLKRNSWVEKYISDPNWRIYQNTDNGASIFVDEKEYLIKENDIIIIPAWTVWRGAIKKPVHHSHISFVTPQWSTLYCRKNFKQIMSINNEHPHYSTINNCFQILRETLSSRDSIKIKSETFAATREAVIHLMLSIFFKTYSPIGEARPMALTKVLEFIDSHINEDLSVEQLASIQLCATAHFSRMFSKLMNQSPSSYVRERRITRASNLLIYSDKTIDQIADLCGFYDRFHFSKLFKNALKRTPVEYKKLNSFDSYPLPE
jgi:AraC-like DNA-binding protein